MGYRMALFGLRDPRFSCLSRTQTWDERTNTR